MKYVVLMLALLAGCAVAPPVEEKPPHRLLPVRGVVLDAQTGKPISGAQIELIIYTKGRVVPGGGYYDNQRTSFFKKLAATDEKGVFIIPPSDSDTVRFTFFVWADDYRPAFFKVDRQGRIVFQLGSEIRYENVPEGFRVILKPCKWTFGWFSEHMIEALKVHCNGSLDSETVEKEIEWVSGTIEDVRSGSGAGRIINELKLYLKELEWHKENLEMEKRLRKAKELIEEMEKERIKEQESTDK